MSSVSVSSWLLFSWWLLPPQVYSREVFPQERVYKPGTRGLCCMHVPREESLYSLSWVGTWLARALEPSFLDFRRFS